MNPVGHNALRGNAATAAAPAVLLLFFDMIML